MATDHRGRLRRTAARLGGSRLVLLGVSLALVACASVAPPAPRTDLGSERLLRGQRAVEVALQYRGAPYEWGASGPSRFDCSGFVRYVYAQLGVSLPHNAARQYEYGTAIPRDSLQPGDLVFFDGLRHNGIYVGNGRFIHARQTGRRVNVASLDEEWYRTRWVGARRL